MNKFEYKTIKFNSIEGLFSLEINIELLDGFLNKHGENGWELVSVTPIVNNGISRSVYYTFKRPI